MTNVGAHCLLKKHATRAVKDLIKYANKAFERPRDNTHIPNQECICIECVQERQGGCRNLHACAIEAATCLNGIAPKYNPIAIEHHNTLSLTPDRKAKNRDTRR
jgi:hypothetical protein